MNEKEEKEENAKKRLRIRLAIVTLTVISQFLVLGGANAGALVESPITFDDVNVNIFIS